jgi:tRNA threonylcarbamoyladenosine biosynthesis protein TsaB
MILTIKTNQPQAEIGLYDGSSKIDYCHWQAHKELSQTILTKIYNLLKKHNKNWHDIKGVVCYKGTGSFTGIRIGLALANALAESYKIPIVGETGDDWIKKGIKKLQNGKNDRVAIPLYGRSAHITKAKK